jgi:hypothetical protein
MAFKSLGHAYNIQEGNLVSIDVHRDGALLSTNKPPEMGCLLTRRHNLALLLSAAQDAGRKGDSARQTRLLPLLTRADSLAGHLRCARKRIVQKRPHRQCRVDARQRYNLGEDGTCSRRRGQIFSIGQDRWNVSIDTCLVLWTTILTC